MKTIYFNGQVYTGTLPLQEAFVVEGEVFTFAGTTQEALSLASPGDETVDLGGQFVCSGFVDSHMHLLGYGNTLCSAQLAGHTHTLRDMVACLTDHAAAHPPVAGSWVFGRGWNHDYFTDVHRMPTRQDLDLVSTTLPVCAVRACGHCLVVNSKALELLGVTAETPQPAGGQIGMEDGVPNGLFFDNAMDMVYAAIPAPSLDDLKKMISMACASLNAYGVTSCHTDDYCVFPQVSWELVNRAYQELEAEGALTVRVYEQCNFTSLPRLAEFVESGHVTGVGSPYFRLGPLKMLGDGALGARTAHLSRPYADDPSTSGLAVFDEETTCQMVDYAHRHGMQVAIHAIGDGCLDTVLTACAQALEATPRENHRHGVVHCQISRREQLERIAALGMHVYCQSIFLDYDNHIVTQRVGEELAGTSYSWKTLLSLGATVSNGSDCPVELPNVMAGIQCGVTRTTLDGTTGPYLPGESFTVQEALDSYTKAGAYASFEESFKGQIAPGMAADFVVLGQNPFHTPANQLKDIPVCATYVGGTAVYGTL